MLPYQRPVRRGVGVPGRPPDRLRAVGRFGGRHVGGHVPFTGVCEETDRMEAEVAGEIGSSCEIPGGGVEEGVGPC